MADDDWVTVRPGQAGLTVAPLHGNADTLVLPPGATAARDFSETTGDFGRAAADTASFGTYPHAMAGYNYATGAQPNYSAALNEQLKTLQDARTRSPYATSAGDVAGTVGMGGVLGLGRAGGRAATWLGRLGLAATEGAGIGGLEALGHTYSTDPAELAGNTLLGTGIGALAGGSAPVIGAAVARGGRAVANIGSSVPENLVRAAQTDEPALTAMIARARQAQQTGEPFREMLPDAGPAMLAQGQGVALNPVMPGQAQFIRNLRGRQDTAPVFVQGQLDTTLGRSITPSFERESLQTQMKNLGPHYDRVFNGPAVRSVDTEPIANWLEAEAVNSRDVRRAAAQRVRRDLDITDAPGVLDPNPSTLQATRSAVRNTLRNETGTLTGAERGLLEEADRRMTAELQRKVPGIRDVDNRYAELAAQHDALGPDSAGTNIFKTEGPNLVRPEELDRKLVEAANPKGTAGPSQEPMRLEQAARAEIERIVGTKRNDVVALRNVLGQPQDWNAQKLAILFGQDRADRIMAVLDREATAANTYNKVVEGSQTAMRSAAARAQEATGGGANVGDTVWGDIKRIGNYALRQARDAAAQGNRERIAQILMANNPAAVQRGAETLLRAGATRDSRQAVARALMQQGFINTTAGIVPKNLVTEDR